MGTKRVGLGRTEALIENLKRSLNLSGSVLVGQKRPAAETITTTKALTAGDSGKIFLLDSADETAACAITLPELDTDHVGVNYEFAVLDPSNGSFTITTGDVTNTTGDQFIGALHLATDQVSGDSNHNNMRAIATSANDSRIVLDGNAANGGGQVGTRIKCTAVSATQWLVEGRVVCDSSSQDDSTGATVFANAS